MKKIILIMLMVSVFSGCIEDGIAGKYTLNNESYIQLNDDGTFQQKGIRYHMPFATEGQYTVNEPDLTLHYPYGFFTVFTIVENGLKDGKGAIYEKQS